MCRDTSTPICASIHWKTKGRQFDNFAVTDGAISCHVDNLQCHKWLPTCQIDYILFSVYSIGSALNSLWPSNAYCLMTPSHYLNQCWLLINQVLWRLLERNFTASVQTTILYDMSLKITATSPGSLWVKRHYNDVIMPFVRRIPRWPTYSPHEGPVARKMFLFDHVIMVIKVERRCIWYTQCIRREVWLLELQSQLVE